MRYLLLALAFAACSRSQAPASAAAVDSQQEVAPLSDDATAVDAADAVSPADAPSAVTP